MKPPLYQIVNYEANFENAKSMCYVKPQFVCVPNKHGGSGLSNVQAEQDGAAIYGIWMWILQMCSRQTCGRYANAGGKKTFQSARDGYLTADGTKEGRRLSARELSNMFRRPIEEIHRCLQVVQSREVGFIRLLDGAPEHIAGSPVPESGSAVTDSETALPSEQDYSPGIRDQTSLDSSTERKNRTEEKEREGSRREAGSGSQQPPHSDSTASPVPEAGSAVTDSETDLIQHSEAKRILGQLAKDVFPDEEPGSIWNNRLEHDLDEMLPLKRSVLEKVDWAYRLPENDRLFEDGPRGGGMMRVKSFAALIPNLKREASKVTAARRKLGLNGLHAPPPSAEPEPPGWETAFVALWGDRPDRPQRFAELTTTQQGAVREICHDMEGATQ